MLHFRLMLVISLLEFATAGYYTTECESDFSSLSYVVLNQKYDVTDNEYDIYSHDNYHDRNYDINYESCIDIWTNQTDHVIKLEEKEFALEDGGYGASDCFYDYLLVFYTSLDNADYFGEENQWCGTSGPGTLYSSGSHMFLFFNSDSSDVDRGFKFTISSIHEDDVPIQLSTGAIVGIVFGVVAVIVIIIVIVICVLINKKKPGIVHPNQQGQPANRNAVRMTTTNTTYNRQPVGGFAPPPQYQQQPVGGFAPPPQYQQQPPPNYSARPAVQPFGAQQPLAPPPAQDAVYPPPAALYNTQGGPQTAAPYPTGPPPAY